jgi:tetratricopeptide (TPR) repeat protein
MRAALAVPLLLLALAARADDLVGEVEHAADDVEIDVHALLVHAMTGQASAVDADVARFAAADDARRQAGLSRTGLTDDARFLAAALVPSRDAQRKALGRVLDAHPDPTVEALAEHERDADEGETGDRLLSDDRHDRRAAVVNDAVRPLGAFSSLSFLAALNPFLLAGTAVDAAATTAVNLWNYNALSPREREALVRYRTLLERVPDTADAPEVARAIRKLGAKQAKALCEDTVGSARRALDADDLDHARFYLASARRLDHCTDGVEKVTTRLSRALAVHDAREEAGAWPVDDPIRAGAGEEERDHEALAVATAIGEPSAMASAALGFTSRHAKSPLAPQARYVLAIARDRSGHRDEARSALSGLAHDGHSSPSRHAAAVLASPEMEGVAAIDDAERRHSRDVTKWVLLGNGLTGRGAVYSAAQLGASGLQGAQTLGIFNVVGVLERAWSAWRKDPVSNQTVIDRGEELLARDPTPAEAAAAHARLADAYERAQNYGRALMHYEATPAPDPKRVKALQDKLADTLLEEAKHRDDPTLLHAIADHLGETHAADKARAALKDRPGTGDVVVARDVLVAVPSLAGPQGLDLDPGLLDDDPDNGELADAGVTLADGQLRLTLADPHGSGTHVETHTLAPDVYARAHAAAEDAVYTRLVTAPQREPGRAPYERFIPIYLEGGIGDDGLPYGYAGVKPRPYKSEDPQLYQ